MPNVDHSIIILNRLLTRTGRGIEVEADPRHVEILLREVGCEGAKDTTSLVKEHVEEALESEELDGSMIAIYLLIYPKVVQNSLCLERGSRKV